MSRTIYLTAEEYTKLWEKHSSTMRQGVPDVAPQMKNMTVEGLSGPGTPFANEHDRLTHEHWNNTKLPVSITVVEGDGMIVYMTEKSEDMGVIEIIETELRKANSGHYSYSSRQHARDIYRAIKEFMK